jgi:hypothetical protein
LSILAKAHFYILWTVRKKVGMEVRIDFTNSSPPGYEKKLHFHLGSLAAIFWTIGFINSLVGFLKCKGKPRYLQGKLDMTMPEF